MTKEGWVNLQEIARFTVFGAVVGAELGAVMPTTSWAPAALEVGCPLFAAMAMTAGGFYARVFNKENHVRGGMILWPAINLIWGSAVGALVVSLVLSWPGSVAGFAVGWLLGPLIYRERRLLVASLAAVAGSLFYTLGTATDASLATTGRAALAGAIAGPMSVMLYGLLGSIFVHRRRDEDPSVEEEGSEGEP
ncbi:MAG TPA: hypothetical protein VNH11_28535, partial [Pirellulales bacterium]|nr:hypothetical protein [Pirellulales bacterium]